MDVFAWNRALPQYLILNQNQFIQELLDQFEDLLTKAISAHKFLDDWIKGNGHNLILINIILINLNLHLT